MITEVNINHWYVLHTSFGLERKLMRCLIVAGYSVFYPTQTVFKKWKGQTKEVIVPLFPGCLFVEASASVVSFAAAHNATPLMDNADKILSISADKVELSARFAQLLK